MTAAPPTTTTPLLRALKRHWGYDGFRPLQEDAIRATLEGRDSLVVLPTGAGKSLCYQLPAVVRGDTVVVVSPLIALMKDQVDKLRAAGIPAAAHNSALDPGERRDVERDLLAGRLRLLFVSPERLAVPSFRQLLSQVAVRAFAIDESHCISHWGHDFRPEYRQLGVLRRDFPHASLHAFTATATPRVRQDVVAQLQMRDPLVLVGDFDRPNLTWRVSHRAPDPISQVQEVLGRHKGEAGIIYCISRREVDELAAALRGRRVRALPYHAGLDTQTRRTAQDAFMKEDCDVIVATIAFGMGIDRSNVRFVLHNGMPKALEHYQQEAGRAGRDGLPAECVLLFDPADVERWEYIFDRSEEEASRKPGAQPPDPAIRAAHRAHLRQMLRYCESQECRRRALVGHFGQQYAFPLCGGCDVCLRQARRVDDPTTLAQKVLSCVARVNEGHGVDHVVDVLLGRVTESVGRASHELLTTFGLLADFDEFLVRDWISQLIGLSLLKVEGEPAVVRLGVPVNRLRSLPPVLLLEPSGRAAGGSADAAWAGVDRELLEELRQVRRQVARQQGLAPDVVFSDLALREMARSRPVRTEQLAALYGVGEVKARNLGGPFLQAIAARWPAREAPHRQSGRRRKAETRAREAEQAARAREEAQQAAAFLKAVVEHPDDDGPREAYAEWLQQRDDPRGEFIRVQCSLARLPEDDPRAPAYESRERVLLADHRATWLGRLAVLTEHCEFHRGFVDSATVTIDRFVGQAEELFRLAPLRRLHCRGSDWLLPRLLASPHLNRLEALSLREMPLGADALHALATRDELLRLKELDLTRTSLDDECVAVLARARPLGLLQRLVLADNPLVTETGARALAESSALTGLAVLDLRGCSTWSERAREELVARFGKRVLLPHCLTKPCPPVGGEPEPCKATTKTMTKTIPASP